MRSTSSSNTIWDFHDAIIQSASSQSESSNTDFKNDSIELNKYLQLPLIPRTDDIFRYWKNVETTFPILSKLAFQYLPVIATSVPSERIFSKAGNTKRDRRNRLTGKHLNMLLFLSSFEHCDWFKI